MLLDESFPIERLRDLDAVARLLARQKPAWPPGTKHGYHASTIGLYMQEIIRRVDPAHRTLGRFFAEEIARPLNIEFYIGLPPDILDERIARVTSLSIGGALLALRTTPPELIRKIVWPWSLLRKSLMIPTGVDWNNRLSLEVELPAGNGVGTARAMARAYAAFADGGAEVGVGPRTIASITAEPTLPGAKDEVLGLPAWYALGFLRPGPNGFFGSTPRAFGTPGAGGSFAFADPDARLGYAYVMNRLGYHLLDDPREKALRDAIYRAIARAGGPETDCIKPGPHRADYRDGVRRP